MKLRVYKTPVTRRSTRGFALIVTLSLMILLKWGQASRNHKMLVLISLPAR
jgi:hypothetical protein